MSQKPVTGLLIDGALNQNQGKLIQKALQNQPFISNKKSKTGRLITFEPSSHMPLDPTIYLKEPIQDMVSLINGLVPHVDRYLVVTENDIDPLYLLFLKATQKPFTVLVDTHVLTDNQMADLIRKDKTLRQRFEKRIQEMPAISTLLESDDHIEALLKAIYGDEPYKRLSEEEIRFQCDCSHERFMKALASLPSSDLQEMKEEDHGAEITCQFCQTTYNFDENDLEELIRDKS